MEKEYQYKRLGIFAYYDEEGNVDDYVSVLLDALHPFCEKIICIVNGKLTIQAQDKLSKSVEEIRFRENQGYDVTAYKETFLSLSEAEKAYYDEILFFNHTVYGPVYPLAPMFEEMQADKDLDFWGLTRHDGLPVDPWGTIEYGYLPPHIQSYFFAVRASLFRLPVFTAYWETMRKVTSYHEAVGFHEARFTKYFEDMGFKSDTYIKTEEAAKSYIDYPQFNCPAQWLAKTHCPLIKRKNFLSLRKGYVMVHPGEEPQLLYDYLRKETMYNVELIVQNITRTVPVRTYTYSLTPCMEPLSCKLPEETSLAAVGWFTRKDLTPRLAEILAQLPEQTPVYAVCNTPETEKILREKLSRAKTIITQENGMETVFTVLWPQIKEKEFIWYLHDAAPQVRNELYDIALIENAWRSLGNAGACVKALTEDPAIGVLAAAPVSHERYFSPGTFWPQQKEELWQFLKPLELHSHLLEEAPLELPEQMFFARTQAVYPLAALDFKAYRELLFLETEPAAAYLLPLAAQKQKQLVGFLIPAKRAYAELFNLKTALHEITDIWATPRRREIDNVVFRMEAISDFYYERRYQMTLEQAFHAKLSFKEKVWIILQILLKPGTFAKLKKRIHHGGNDSKTQYPPDMLD